MLRRHNIRNAMVLRYQGGHYEKNVRATPDFSRWSEWLPN